MLVPITVMVRVRMHVRGSGMACALRVPPPSAWGWFMGGVTSDPLR